MWVAGGNLRATEVGLIQINGAIGPATASYISRAIDVAAERHGGQQDQSHNGPLAMLHLELPRLK